jgi:hypothetical protein
VKAAITVLTDPVPSGLYFFSEPLKKTVRRIRDRVRPAPAFFKSPYRGHFAVTRSLVEGLQKAGIPSNYNPQRLGDVADTVAVLSGQNALRQAIEWKRSGRVKTLLAGPNLVEFPSDARELLCSPEVNVCITPGSLTCAIYIEDCPELAGRCEAWPAGVDTAYWSPASPPAKRERILLYDKQINGATDAVAPYAALVAAKGYAVATLEYGSYTREQFRQLLRESRLMIGFSAAESQGIAWAEAWSTDVPTLLWYTGEHVFTHPRARGRILRTSTAPHLTDATGRFFPDLDAFATLFARWEAGELQWAPRAWVLKNMSDEACARRLCELAGLRISA